MEQLTTPTQAPQGFHVMTKPRGPICNLDCKYCYYLQKEAMYPNSSFRMSDEVLETFIRQYIEGQGVPEVVFGWQGGEPTLMGLDFFRRAVKLQQKYCKPGMKILNTFQTNGTRLTDEWCEFFVEHDFLIGISLDGPEDIHDFYRKSKGGGPSFQQVMAGVELLKKHKVEFNTLTTVHAGNAEYPLQVYRFLRDDLGSQHTQFIPIVQKAVRDGKITVTPESVTASQYGQFLITIFDEWMCHDFGNIHVQIFESALSSWLGMPAGLCVFEKECGTGLAMEHNGDVFACDHFVEPEFKNGNIMERTLAEMVSDPRQRQFGKDKLEKLPQDCLDCEVRFACNGGCPKNRFIATGDDSHNLNYLCTAYKTFFRRINRPMQIMASYLKQQAPLHVVREQLLKDHHYLQQAIGRASRNEECPCGSGVKLKKCHGRVKR